MTDIHSLRSRTINKVPSPSNTSTVVYWMSRDQRILDNWALLFAQDVALERKQPLIIVFVLSPSFLGATLRQYDFMINGLKEIEKQAMELNIQFKVLVGDPANEIIKFCHESGVSCLISDFSPLKIKSAWSCYIQKNLDIPFYEIDTHNIIPCWEASDKQEYAAYTFRPKITRKLDYFLTDIPSLKKHPFIPSINSSCDWRKLYEQLEVDTSVNPTDIVPGYK
ncbi:deoxyribodipyrimidine photo-lyase, partial [candidate division WWE3 bacterium]|nr:deoxyribodipyrimidine photo-lyase [candidate division WWE3 bacterium]